MFIVSKCSGEHVSTNPNSVNKEYAKILLNNILLHQAGLRGNNRNKICKKEKFEIFNQMG